MPGIVGEELGTDELMEYLLMFKQSSYKDKKFSLRPGSINVLNIPDGNIKKTEELSDRVGDFYVAHNMYFLKCTVDNVGKTRVFLLSDPRKNQVLFKLDDSGKDYFVDKRTIYSSELSYLLSNNVNIGYYLGTEPIDLRKLNIVKKNGI